MPLDETFKSLGIPQNYGSDPRVPRYEDAVGLEEVETNFAGKMQSLAPRTASAWRNMKQAALAEIG